MVAEALVVVLWGACDIVSYRSGGVDAECAMKPPAWASKYGGAAPPTTFVPKSENPFGSSLTHHLLDHN